jgi:hypothetical protein
MAPLISKPCTETQERGNKWCNLGDDVRIPRASYNGELL